MSAMEIARIPIKRSASSQLTIEKKYNIIHTSILYYSNTI